MEIHANVSDNIMNDGFLKRGYAEEMTSMVMVLIAGFVMGAIFVIMPATLGWAALFGAMIIGSAFILSRICVAEPLAGRK